MKDIPKYVRSKIETLEEFCIRVSDDVIAEMMSLYPNEMAIDRYARSLILHRLKD